jgi:hypothetical protein
MACGRDAGHSLPDRSDGLLAGTIAGAVVTACSSAFWHGAVPPDPAIPGRSRRALFFVIERPSTCLRWRQPIAATMELATATPRLPRMISLKHPERLGDSRYQAEHNESGIGRSHLPLRIARRGSPSTAQGTSIQRSASMAQNSNAPKPPPPGPLHDPPVPPAQDPPSKPLHDPAGDPTYEPPQPATEPTPNPASDPPPEMPGDPVKTDLR